MQNDHGNNPFLKRDEQLTKADQDWLAGFKVGFDAGAVLMPKKFAQHSAPWRDGFYDGAMTAEDAGTKE